MNLNLKHLMEISTLGSWAGEGHLFIRECHMEAGCRQLSLNIVTRTFLSRTPGVPVLWGLDARSYCKDCYCFYRVSDELAIPSTFNNI